MEGFYGGPTMMDIKEEAVSENALSPVRNLSPLFPFFFVFLDLYSYHFCRQHLPLLILVLLVRLTLRNLF